MKRTLFALILLLSSASALAPTLASASLSAQSGNMVYLRVIDRDTEVAIRDACFMIVNASNQGCDADGDGYISFQDVAPGSYTVTQTKAAAGYAVIADFGITVVAGESQQVFIVPLQSLGSSSPDTVDVDIAIVPIDVATGLTLPGACFIIANVSNEGCDENGDGQVTFDAVPVGTYPVTETRAPRGYAIQPDQWVVIERDGQIPFFQGSASNQTGSRTNGLVHVSVVTRDPNDGHLLTGACYVIVNASNEGCDENGDGQVDFADVTPGEYTLTQTSTPRGYPAVNDFKILITRDPTQSFIVKQAPRQNDARHRNVSIVLVDKSTGYRVSGGNACVRIVGASNVGCDENGDGQIDFLDIPVGDHTVEITSMPRGYHGEFRQYALPVDSAHPYSIVTAYLGLLPG